DRGIHRPNLSGPLSNPFQLSHRIIDERIDRHHHGHPMGFHVRNVLLQVRKTFCQCLLIRPGKPYRKRGSNLDRSSATVKLECAKRSYHHGRCWLESREATLDVEKFLRPEITPESSLRNDIVCTSQCDGIGKNRTIPVGDITERTRMHERRGSLQRLNQIRQQRISKQYCHGPGTSKLFCPYWLTIHCNPNDDLPEPVSQVGLTRCQSEHRHDFGSFRDHKLARATHSSLSQRDLP